MAGVVFLSYSSQDTALAQAIRSVLESADWSCWFGPRDISSGLHFAEEIVHALSEARLILLIYSSASLLSPYVQREIAIAVSLGKPILPMRIANVSPTAAMRFYLQPYQFYEALGRPIEPHLERLPSQVAALLRAPADVRDLSSAPPPWIRRLDDLRASDQITELTREQTRRFVLETPSARTQTEAFATDWLAEQTLSGGKCSIQQALTAVCSGFDVRVVLLGLNFSLVPPGYLRREDCKNRLPFYLSELVLTSEQCSTALRAAGHPIDEPRAGLSLVMAELILDRLNRALALDDAMPCDTYRLRLPTTTELQFAVNLHGAPAAQRCWTLDQVKDSSRHPLRLAGLVGGLWQFAIDARTQQPCLWGGSYASSREDFAITAPIEQYPNAALQSREYGLRIAVDVLDDTYP